MRRHHKGEEIGYGCSKEVHESEDDPNLVVAEFHHPLTNEQVKSAYYLGKITHLLFPKNVPDMAAAFNDKTGESILYIRKGFRDPDHDRFSRMLATTMKPWYQQGKITEDDRASMRQYFNANEQDPKVKKLCQQARTKGLKFDYGGQNFSRDEEENILYLETNPAWEYRYDGSILYHFDPKQLRTAIEETPEPIRSQAIHYYQRLLALMPK